MSEAYGEFPFELSSYHLELGDLSKLDFSVISGWESEPQKKYAPKRLIEWKAGRLCAKKAAKKAGYELNSLPAREDRSPKWPDGIVGSISHTKKAAVAVVSDKAKSVGIDVESPIEPERLKRIQKSFMTDDEEKAASVFEEGPTLIFSAKEALYKAVRPLCGVYFGFHEACLRNVDENNFWLELRSDQTALKSFNGVYKGGYTLRHNFIFSWIEML